MTRTTHRPETVPTQATPSPAAPTRRRAPIGLRVAAALLVLLMTVSTAGLVLFGFVWNDDPVGPGLVFAAVVVAGMATALAALPGMLRGDSTRWLVVVGWVVAYDYWSVYKVFGEQEFESAGFLVTGLVIAALLTGPAARRHVGASSAAGTR